MQWAAVLPDEQTSEPGGHHDGVDAAGAQRHFPAFFEAAQRLAAAQLQAAEQLERRIAPAWQLVTQGESRWPVTGAIVVAIGMQFALPPHQLIGPRWLLPGLASLVLVILVVANPRRINRLSPMLRVLSLGLIGTLSVANAWAAGKLIDGLIQGTAGDDAAGLLLNGGAIWLTNIIVFALWYWEFDRGGPAARAQALRPYPSFLFVQMQSPEMTSPHWEPGFVDYLYLSFTNATAFSPTDVLPLSRWAKLTMMAQSAVSLMTVALVIARAVNILK